ncbi:MAG: NAD(P)-dependent oxidoreductase [Symbiopectobacterium sp.]
MEERSNIGGTQQRQEWDRHLSGLLTGKTLLIVGASDIGAEVAAMLRSFGVMLDWIVNCSG